MYPKLMMGLEFFNLEGVDGNVKNWKEYGQWFSDKILTGTTDLSPETIAKIKSLVGTETDPIKKAKIVYKYIPATTQELYDSPTFVSDIFADMFNSQTPWTDNFRL